jgi:hypothetical protein
MGMRQLKRRFGNRAADKTAATRAMITEADQRWHRLARFLERSRLSGASAK